MFRLTLLLVAFSLSILGLKAQIDCNCNQQVVVQVNAQCTYVLTKTQLGIKNCPNSYIAVLDNKPQNRDTIDAPGSYTYGLYQNDGRLICLGNVMAMSPSGPVLDSVNFLQDTFSFQQIGDIFNRPNTTGVPGSNLSLINNSTRVTNDGRMTELVTDNVANLGVPFFSMGCQTPRCGITLSFSDELVYSACREAQRGNLYATIRRSWLARDCQGRINSSAQFIHFKNPEKADFVWNLQNINERKINLYYGECTFEPNTRVWSSVFPVTSQKGKAIFSAGLKISQAIQTKADTVCEGKGIELTQNYLIYDECRNLVIDTFSVVLSPGAINNTWIDAPGDTIFLTVPPKVCRIGLPQKSTKALLDLLQIKLKTLCGLQYFDWVMEQQVSPKSNQWAVVNPVRDSLYFHPGYSRISLTVLDSCQNLHSKVLYVLLKDSAPFDFSCPSPFEATFELKNGKKYYSINTQQTFNIPYTQCRQFEFDYRRVIPPGCLPNFLANPAYDLDGDGDVMEHFTLIRSGQFARQYYSPWVVFIEAFECDEDNPVYYEQRAYAPDEELEDICLSFFTVSSLKPVEFSFADATVKMGAPLCIPLKANGLKNILGLQLSIKYNPQMLQFDSLKNITKNILYGSFAYPDPVLRPALNLSWVSGNVKPVNFPANSTLFEMCFTPLAIGASPIWVDTSKYRIEVTNENGVNLEAKSRVGVITVIDKNDFRNPIKQIQDTPPLSNPADRDKKVPDIRVFPNPSTGIINVVFPEGVSPEGVIRLKDAQGKIIKQELVFDSSIQMQLTNLSEGVYFLEYLAPTWICTKRIIMLGSN